MALSPKEVAGFDKKTVKDIVKQIDEMLKFAGECRTEEWFSVIIHQEIRADLRNAVAKEYIDAGWDMIVHQTATENGERPGFTYFAFLTEYTIDAFFRGAYMDSEEKRKKYYVVTKHSVKGLGEEKEWRDLNGSKS